jgi:hypothetical protein
MQSPPNLHIRDLSPQPTRKAFAGCLKPCQVGSSAAGPCLLRILEQKGLPIVRPNGRVVKSPFRTAAEHSVQWNTLQFSQSPGHTRCGLSAERLYQSVGESRDVLNGVRTDLVKRRRPPWWPLLIQYRRGRSTSVHIPLEFFDSPATVSSSSAKCLGMRSMPSPTSVARRRAISR